MKIILSTEEKIKRELRYRFSKSIIFHYYKSTHPGIWQRENGAYSLIIKTSVGIIGSQYSATVLLRNRRKWVIDKIGFREYEITI